MSLFGMFKCMRVFRMGSMIARSTAESESKAFMNLFKLCFYLFFYLHILACYFWVGIGFNQGTRYYRTTLELPGTYVSQDGDTLLDIGGLPVEADDDVYLRFGPAPTFATSSWNRYTADERPDWEAENEKWDSKERIWWMTVDWVNYGD
jgi:hypothetical protein